MPDLLTPAEVAAILRISPAATYALLDTGAIRSHRVGVKGGRRRVPREAVDEYLRRTAVPAVAMPTKQKRRQAVPMDYEIVNSFIAKFRRA